MTTKTKKATKKSPAKKAAKKATGPRRARHVLAPEMKLKLVKNDFREGTTRHKAATLAGKSKTVKDYLGKKGDLNYLSWLVRFGHVSATGAAA